MKYDDPELIDRLAAEYVLGTLHGHARLRFDRLLQQRDDIRRQVWIWESHLGEMANDVTRTTPPEQVWVNIDKRISSAGSQSTRSNSRSIFTSLWFWRGWSFVASLAAATLLTLLLTSSKQADHVALVGDPAEPQWVISANLNSGELSARAVNASAAELDRVFELWMLPDQGPPQSIGLLPVNGGRVQHQLPAALRSLLLQSRGLAISIEPPGGSPTGLPTGEVIYTSTVFEL